MTFDGIEIYIKQHHLPKNKRAHYYLVDKSNDPYKYLGKEREMAKDILSREFNIEVPLYNPDKTEYRTKQYIQLLINLSRI